MTSRDDDLRAFARRPRAEVQALKLAAHARSGEERLRAAAAMADHLAATASAASRAEDLLHHVALAARLGRFDRVRVR
jgi:hypothetical protein